MQLANVMEKQKELQQANMSTNILAANRLECSTTEGREDVMEGKIPKNTLPSSDHTYVEMFNFALI